MSRSIDSRRVPVRVAVGLGSNLGDREENLRRAISGLRDILDQVAVSRVWESLPEHGAEQPDYLNACVVGVSRLTPRQLLSSFQDLERAIGRIRSEGRRAEPRTIDLDLLLYDAMVVDERDLRVPHPCMRNRAFVLLPLAEIAPYWVVPGDDGEPFATVGDLADRVLRAGVEVTGIELDDG